MVAACRSRPRKALCRARKCMSMITDWLVSTNARSRCRCGSASAPRMPPCPCERCHVRSLWPDDRYDAASPASKKTRSMVLSGRTTSTDGTLPMAVSRAMSASLSAEVAVVATTAAEAASAITCRSRRAAKATHTRRYTLLACCTVRSFRVASSPAPLVPSVGTTRARGSIPSTRPNPSARHASSRSFAASKSRSSPIRPSRWLPAPARRW